MSLLLPQGHPKALQVRGALGDHQDLWDLCHLLILQEVQILPSIQLPLFLPNIPWVPLP